MSNIPEKTFCIVTSDFNKKKFTKMSRKLRMNVTFYKPKVDEDISKAHISIIAMAKKFNLSSVMIFEDIAKILRPLIIPKPVPSNWDMLYFGGDIDIILDHTSESWKKGKIHGTYAYIVRSTAYNAILSESKKLDDIDDLYYSQIHPNRNAYMCSPMQVFHCKTMTTKDLQETPEKLNEVETDINESGICRLKMPNIPRDQLPNISIVSCLTRSEHFELIIRNFYMTDYPRDKMELVLIDSDSSGDISKENIKLIERDSRIHYLKISNGPSFSALRNTAIESAKNTIILHMDEFYYYYPIHAITRVLALQDKKCVGCTKVGFYDMGYTRSYYDQQLDVNGHSIIFNEASLGYHRDFWKDRPYNEHVKGNSSLYFIKDRYEDVTTVPSEYIVLGLSYGCPEAKSGSSKNNFIEQLDRDSREFIDCIKGSILKTQ